MCIHAPALCRFVLDFQNCTWDEDEEGSALVEFGMAIAWDVLNATPGQQHRFFLDLGDCFAWAHYHCIATPGSRFEYVLTKLEYFNSSDPERAETEAPGTEKE
eukprot:TRINITY_DN68025_c6_g2_i1.p1 TRINITY_DN68025_c6_g2~~TRINITY_DN68025_c6_g2_i1.p1  ORF type:complete len:103 (+),score=4.05 TRINITY_DN68025_c6_g2_i1:778-1086(+)